MRQRLLAFGAHVLGTSGVTMNSCRVQRLILSLLHDPSFRSQLEHNPTLFESRYECTRAEIEHVLSFDPRLFRADPLRADRLLTGLLDLYPVSIWSVFERGVFVKLRAFFESSLFHQVIWDRGLVHQSFGQYLTRCFPAAASFVQIECAVEDARTVPRDLIRSNGQYILNPSVHVLTMKTGYLDSWVAARALIAQTSMSGAAFLLEQTCPLTQPDLENSSEFILIEGGSVPSVGGISASLAEVLMYLQTPRSFKQLVEQLMSEGADETECSDLIQDFITNRWIEGQVFSPEC